MSLAMTLLAVHAHPLAITEEGLAREKKEMKESIEDWTSIDLFVIASLQLILVFIAYRLDRAKTPVLISESVCGMFLGVLVGLVMRFLAPEATVKMDPQVLIYALLPPIILEAGFSMKKRGFFANFSTILLLAVVGTLVAMFVIGGTLMWLGNLGFITKLSTAEAYLYGALISAVDPVATLSVFKKHGVPPLLFNLVFGESMLNDGVAIVAFTLFQRMIEAGKTDVTFHEISIVISQVFGIGFGSVFLATVVCCTSAFLLKRADTALHEHPAYELSIVLLSAYLSYVAADMAGLSGIVALFFSAVLMSHYHLHTISVDSANALRHLLATAAFVAENFVFIYLGMSVVAYSSNFIWDWRFIFCNMVVIMVARVFSTFPLIALANIGRKQRIPWSFMVVTWFAGLRGAIAFALALNVWTPDSDHAKVIQSTTLFTVMFTTVVFGMGTSPILRYYRLSRNSAGETTADEASESLLSGSEEHELGHFKDVDEDDEAYRNEDHPSRFPPQKRGGIHGLWERMDEKYFKPLFGGLPRLGWKSSHQRHGSSDMHRSSSYQPFHKLSTQSPLTKAEIAQDYDDTQL